MSGQQPWKTVKHGFSDRRGFWYFAAVVLGEVSLLKGLRYPNEWAATQAQIDYSHGLVKRGLFGAAVTDPLHLNSYARFAAVSELLLVALLAALATYAVRSRVARKLGTALPVAVFFASYTVTYLGHLAGYLDIPLALAAVVLLLVKSDAVRFTVGVPVTVAAVLMHENFAILFLPVVLLSFALSALREDGKAGSRKRWAMAAALAVVALGATALVSLRPSLTLPETLRLRAEIAAHTDFAPAPAFFRVMGSSLADNLAAMKLYHRDPAWWHELAVSAAVFLPTILALLGCCWLLLRSARIRRRGACMTLAVLATASPLLLHLVGWDVERWNALTGLAAFLVLLTVAACTDGDDDAAPVPQAWQNAMVLVIALSMASGGLLMDGAMTRWFPFF